jgi:hypothetical protein
MASAKVTDKLPKSVIQATENRLSFLQDNRYRYVNLGKYSLNDPVVKAHDEEIAELEKFLKDHGAVSSR